MTLPEKASFLSPEGGSKAHYSYQDLLDLMAFLRGPEGCPWDREQTHQSIRSNLLEEAYEAVESLDGSNDAAMQEELGDVLLQVLFHAQIAKEEGRFDMEGILQALATKLISRHSHLFGSDAARTAEEGHAQWEANKQKERGKENRSDFDRIPKSLPALSRSLKIQRLAAKQNFDWRSTEGVLEKIQEEAAELAEAQALYEAGQDPVRQEAYAQMEEEAGDLLFIVVNFLRHLKIDPELALHLANEKFIKRYSCMRALAEAEKQALPSLDDASWHRYWLEAKKRVKEADDASR